MRFSIFSIVFVSTMLLVVSGCGRTDSNLPEIETMEDITPKVEQLSAPVISALSSDDLVGGWAVEGSLYDEISINDDGTYSTYLHQNPFSDGTWSFVVGALIMDSENFGKEIYSTVSQEGNDIVLENDEGKEEVWKEIIQ